MRWLNNQFFKEEFQSFAAGESSVALTRLDYSRYGQRMLRPKSLHVGATRKDSTHSRSLAQQRTRIGW